MPELPEVETVVNSIKPKLENQRIADCQIYNQYSRIIQNKSYPLFRKKILGQKIIQVRRRAKYIICQLSSGYLIFHLRMTGQFQFCAEPPKHTTFSLTFSKSRVHFVDQRKFGTIEFRPDLISLEARLGPEPLGDQFNFSDFTESLRSSGKKIKSYLLDQSKIAGLGNIYVDEVLWQAKIHPEMKTSEITSAKQKALFVAIPEVLRQSIQNQGTTFINFYFEESKSGNFQKMLKVFNRDGDPCSRCKRKIIKTKIAGRGTHFCPKCQQIKRI